MRNLLEMKSFIYYSISAYFSIMFISQDHYDFGMRAVKTVILVAGNLIRQMPDGDERQIVLRALRDVNVPKFLADDLLLFNG